MTPKPERSQFRWQREEVVALLAWADFCIKFEIDFANTVEDHMRETSEIFDTRASITTAQAKQKLLDMARSYSQSGVSPLPSRQMSVSLGTACMARLPSDLREAIQVKMNAYERHNLARCSMIVGQAVILNEGNKEDAGGSTPNTLENVSPNGHDHEAEDGRAGLTQKHANSNEEGKAANGRKYTNSIQSKRRIQCDPVLTPSLVASPPVLKPVVNTTQMKHKDEIARKEEEIRKIRIKWQEESYGFAQQLSRSNQTIHELRAQIKHRDMAEKTCQEAGKNPMEDTLFQYMHQNWSLLQRVQEMKKKVGYCQRTPEQSQGLMESCMRESVGTIESELESLLHGHDHYASLVIPLVRRESDLGALIRSMFGVSSGEEIVQFRRCIGKYGSEPEVIVRAFVSTALKEWVFSSNFPGFSTRSQLLDAYRRIVISHDGWSCARNLELEAYRMLMDEPKFKSSTIPKLAFEFATKFSDTLAPLFPIRVEETPNFDSRSWGQLPDVVGSRNFRLVGIFSAALVLKASSVLAENSFEFITYPPGTNKGMNQAESFSISPSSKSRKDDERQSWLYASLHMYRPRPSFPADAAADALVNQRNFVTRTIQDRTAECVFEARICFSSEGPQKPSSSSDFGLAQGSFNIQERDVGATTVQRKSHSRDPDSPIIHSGRNGKFILVSSDSEDTASDASGEDERRRKRPPQSFVCSMCQAKYQSRRVLVVHETTGMCGRCSSCGQSCQNKPDFTKHQKQQHPGDHNIVLDPHRKPKDNCVHNGEAEEMSPRCSSSLGNEKAASGQEAGPSNDALCEKEGQDTNLHENQLTYPEASRDEFLAAPGNACNKCGKLFAYMARLDRHIKEDMCGQCSDCKLWFESRSLLQAHRKGVHGASTTNDDDNSPTDEDSRLELGQCSKTPSASEPDTRKRATPSNESEIEFPINLIEGKKYECTSCTRMFPTPWERDAHNPIHECDLVGHRASKGDDVDGVTEATCRQCGNSFIPQPFVKKRKLSQNMPVRDSSIV